MANELDKILIKYDQPDFGNDCTEIQDSRYSGPHILTARKKNN